MTKLESDGVAGWPPVLEQLLAGVSHQLSNRIATLSGVSDLLAGDPTIPPILRALADEVPRLEEALRLLRLLSVPEGEGDEPLEPARVLEDALALARLHPALKSTTYDVVLPAALPPVLAPPTRLTHALVVALAQASAASGPTIPVRVRSDANDVIFDIGGACVRVPRLAVRRA